MGPAFLISSVLLMVAMVRGQMFTNRDSMSAGPERTVTTIQRTETRTMGDGTGSDVTARFGSSDPQNNIAFGGFGPTNLGSNNFMASNAASTGNNVAMATNEVSRTSFVRMPTDAPSPTSSIVSSSSSSSSSVPLSSLSSSLTSSASSPMVNRGSAMTTNTRMFDNNRNRNTVMTSNTRVSVSNGNNPRVGCVLQSIPNQVTKYRVHLFSLGSSLDFYCARGTIFYPEKCACDWPEDRNMVLPFVPTTQSPIRPFPGEVIPNGGMGSGIIRPFSTTPEPCRFRADNDRNYYQEFVPGFGWSRRRCPIGTLYREESCKCDDMAPVSSLRCTPELYVPFDVMPIEDMAGTSIPIGNNGNVDSVANAGRFDGSGRLTIWMYSNMDFGKQLTINLRFYDFPGGAEEQVLVSNCFDKELGSIEIATHPRNKEVVFRGNSNQTPGIQFTLPYQDKMWKNVTLIYDGSHLVGKVNNEERAMPMKGNLDVRFSGFEIGMCNGRGFVGYIDELTVFRCVDPMQKPTPR